MLSSRKNSVKRRGGTELVNYDEWKAEDTESYWEFHNVGRIFKRCGRRENPIAWGEQQAHPDDADQDDSAGRAGRFAGHQSLCAPACFLRSVDRVHRPAGFPGPQRRPAEARRARIPRLKLQVRLTRKRDQLATPEGRSAIRQAPDPAAPAVM